VSLPTRILRSHGFRALQSFSPRIPRKLMACFHPFRPRLSPDPRVFSIEAARRVRILLLGPSSHTLRRHPSVFPSRKPPSYSRVMPTMTHFRKAPRSECLALQHIRIVRSLFSPSFEGVRPAFALRSGGPTLRVWLPFRRCSSHPTLGSIFQLPTLMGFALQSFSPTR